MKSLFLRKKQAETLLEVIIALGVLMITLGYSGTLIASAISQIARNQNHIIATNLAKEGIEVMRNLIGTNLLRLQSDAANCWNAGFTGDGGHIVEVKDCANHLLGGNGSPALNTQYYFRLLLDTGSGRFSFAEEEGLIGLSTLDSSKISASEFDCTTAGGVVIETPCINGSVARAQDIPLSTFAVYQEDPRSSSGLYRHAYLDNEKSASRFFRIIEIRYHDVVTETTPTDSFDAMEVISHVFYRDAGEFREVRLATIITPFIQ